MKIEGGNRRRRKEKKNSRLIENVMNIEEVGQGPEADQEGEFTIQTESQFPP